MTLYSPLSGAPNFLNVQMRQIVRYYSRKTLFLLEHQWSSVFSSLRRLCKCETEVFFKINLHVLASTNGILWKQMTSKIPFLYWIIGRYQWNNISKKHITKTVFIAYAYIFKRSQLILAVLESWIHKFESIDVQIYNTRIENINNTYKQA